MKQYPSFGSSHIDQPSDCGAMSAREIEAKRIRILESDRFAERLELNLCNRATADTSVETFSREEIGIIGYYLGMCDKDGLYRYLKELMGKDIESIVRKLEE